MSPKTAKSRAEVLALIEQAQHLLNRAVAAASPLQGWADDEPRGPYYLIGDHADATKRLWHKVNNAPVPTGHDYEDSTPFASLTSTDPFEALKAHVEYERAYQAYSAYVVTSVVDSTGERAEMERLKALMNERLERFLNLRTAALSTAQPEAPTE